MKKQAILLINFYRTFLSPLKPACCRFYPTCSQYALEQFKYNSFFIALCNSIFRILKCNQLNNGGFNYAIRKIKKTNTLLFLKVQDKLYKLKFLFVPYKDERYFIVKIIFKG